MIEKVAVFCKNMLDWFKSDRCFVSHFIKAFPYANNLLLLTMVMLAIFIISMYMIIAAQTGINSILSLLIVIMLSSALAAGFFYTIKSNLDSGENRPTVKAASEIFYSGIGKYYLSFFGMFITFFILATLLIIGTFIFADKFICSINDLGINANDFFMMLAMPNQMDTIMDSITKVQQHNLRSWCHLYLFATQTFTFLMMLWIPEKIYTEKHFLVALFTSIKKIFSDFPHALCVYLTIMFLNYVLAIFIVVLSSIKAIVFILNIASLYLLIFNFFAIFTYYKYKYIDSDDRGWIA